MAWRNVRGRWRHSGASILAIAVGFVAIGLSDGFLSYVIREHASELGHKYMYGDVLIEKAGAGTDDAKEDPLRFDLDERDQAFLEDYLKRRGPAVRVRARFLHLLGFASAGKSNAMFMGFGYDVAEGAALRGEWAWNVIAGVPLERANTDSATVGKGMAAKLNCTSSLDRLAVDASGKVREVAQPFRCSRARMQLTATTERGQVNVVDPTIAGIAAVPLKEIDERLVMMPLPLAQQLLDTRKVSLYSVKLDDAISPTVFVREIVAEAAAHGVALQAVPWRAHRTADMLRQGVDLLKVYRNLTGLVVLLIAGLCVVATMMKAVAERTREVGTLRSLGFRRVHVRCMFQYEAALLALLASGAGLVLTGALTAAINLVHVRFHAGLYTEPLTLIVDHRPATYLVAVAYLAAISQVAAFFPARRAARLGIPDALGHA